MLLYALTKFVAYSLWCFLGLRLLSDCPSIPKALKLGLIAGFLAYFSAFVWAYYSAPFPANPSRLFISAFTFRYESLNGLSSQT